MRCFKSADRTQGLLMPPSINDWLPENHQARFIVDIVEELDLRSVYRQYRGSGTMAYDPRLILSLILYGYSTGVFSSRKIEAATYDSVAFRFISGNHHPDHDTIANFRKRFLPEIKGWFKQVLLIGKELGLLNLGNIYIDGTKVQANASKHKAMSYEYMKRLEEKLETEIDSLLELANQTDNKETDTDLDIPKEIRRRETRLVKIREAKSVVEDRAKERYSKEKKTYDAKIQKRNDHIDKTGKNPRGREPKAPNPSPNESDQYNFTDPESRIMKTKDGFNQCFNGQAAVNDDMIILGAYSNAHANDKREFIPTINTIPTELGEISIAVADTGYFSEDNITECQDKEIIPLISTARQKHNSYLDKKLNENSSSNDNQEQEQEQEQTPIDKMNQLLNSPKYNEIYRKRKQTVEPVFGIIKKVLGFRQFSLRGETETDCEWSLVCLGYNLKRLFKMKIA
ncbi:IS1182 family transposase [Halosquirtibacter xylanolyticus]|uniref:IS1182 family transposase n=1 Tax=Halosquirtibacter xylanolyticus TaxID=3374599 RepID=UPI00374A136F|nr:IS1182 family transposase [Prolixibacteraceae bacterium]QZT36116.1 IS1182 family transposase [Prolixibacteraceae bacterium]QZT38402.1 IS1182 family transposase [Prolixibacteraceae bacterium]